MTCAEWQIRTRGHSASQISNESATSKEAQRLFRLRRASTLEGRQRSTALATEWYRENSKDVLARAKSRYTANKDRILRRRKYLKACADCNHTSLGNDAWKKKKMAVTAR